MDGLSSFYPVLEGIDYLVNSDSEVALFQFTSSIHSFEQYQCKVCKQQNNLTMQVNLGHCLIPFHMFLTQIITGWKAPTPIFMNSMFMKKNSPFTRFISNKITKLAETGITNNLYKRHVISEPNCKSIQVKGQKFAKENLKSLNIQI